MAKRKKTLPKDFDELIDAGNLDKLKAVFDKCELNAYGGYRKSTALAFFRVPDELVCWLVEQGADINVRNQYQQTPLHEQASSRCSNIPLFLELGADIEALDYRKETPLYHAASSFQLYAVKDLLAYGANCSAENDMQETPLGKMLSVCRNSDIAKAADIAELMLKSGALVDNNMRRSVQRIGTEFEFYKEDFNKDYLEETENGLSMLYQLFKVTPVSPRRIHDGISSITVASIGWQNQHKELWDLLVPANGYAKTVQGEVVRITGRISYELLDNGGANWDCDYKKMLMALWDYLSSGDLLKEKEQKEMKQLIQSITRNSGEEISRLTELAVGWVLLNPAPIKLKKPEYIR